MEALVSSLPRPAFEATVRGVHENGAAGEPSVRKRSSERRIRGPRLRGGERGTRRRRRRNEEAVMRSPEESAMAMGGGDAREECREKGVGLPLLLTS